MWVSNWVGKTSWDPPPISLNFRRENSEIQKTQVYGTKEGPLNWVYHQSKVEKTSWDPPPISLKYRRVNSEKFKPKCRVLWGVPLIGRTTVVSGWSHLPCIPERLNSELNKHAVDTVCWLSNLYLCQRTVCWFLESGIDVVQVYATIIQWCTDVSFTI